MLARDCRTCAKAREMIAAAWHAVVPRHCVVRGCRGTYPICRRHWLMLPIKLRQRWWEETDYSGQPPGKDLIEAVNARVNRA